MSLQDLSLPIDVPWRLIATSADMLANHADRFPHAMWKSSVAIFAYDPDLSDLPEVFPDRELTFLKVACSITSYTPPCLPCPPPPDMADYGEGYGAYEADRVAWRDKCDAAKKAEHNIYPCSGAFLQVAVYPSGVDTTDIGKLAYFLSFEPRKRELIEVATESGESVTQSKSNVNLRKGVTSTDSMEDLNVFTGANLNVQVAGTGGGAGITGQWGTIKKSGTERVDTTTSDASRETREGSSHTTSLSQLYHLLNSYHVGTNRAIFFLQPRPHTVQQKDQFTFIDGPQEIEGVQEFFLVVSRPKNTKIEEYCVDGLLYTAHLETDVLRAFMLEPKTTESPWYELWAASEKPAETHTWSLVDILLAFATLGAGVPPEFSPGVATVADVAGSPVAVVEDLFNAANVTHVAEEHALPPRPPTILDANFVAPAGWRIDRTRGLGGYDLWEDSDNVTSTPTGRESKSKIKPQAFVEIMACGNPDDPDHYQPDGLLHIRAFVWTPNSEDGGLAMYHGRIKIYYIRNELPTEDRVVRMFVTARGVSTCMDSPFFDYAPDKAILVAPGEQPEIVADDSIQPPNIAPWRPLEPVPLIASTSPQGNGKDTVPASSPIKSSAPSGLDPAAIGSARAKMANGVSDQVRVKLNSVLACLSGREIRNAGGRAYVPAIRFRETDLFFNRVAPIVAKAELKQLAFSDEPDRTVAIYVAAHLATASLSERATLQALRQLGAKVAPEKVSSSSRGDGAKPNKPSDQRPQRITPSQRLPLLTLGYPGLSDATRRTLWKRGIVSGLDLIGSSTAQLADRLGIDEAKVRSLRLEVLGLTEAAVEGTKARRPAKSRKRTPK